MAALVSELEQESKPLIAVRNLANSLTISIRELTHALTSADV
jgi:hypothetical protein